MNDSIDKYFTGDPEKKIFEETNGELPSVDEQLKIKNSKLKIKYEKRKQIIINTKKIKRVEMSQVGIQETKDVVSALCSFANTLTNVLEDGKLSLIELPSFIGPLTKFPSAFSGVNQVPLELADLDDTEKLELIKLVKDELAVGDEAELIASKALKIAYEVKILIDIIKQTKI